MPSFLAGILVALPVLTVVLEFALPAYLAGRVEDRLEEGGGSARVRLDAFPAVSLLAGRGGGFEAEGTGLRLDAGFQAEGTGRRKEAADRRENPLKRLDGFKRVDVTLSDLAAGPLRAGRFELRREGRGEDYALLVKGVTTPREVADQLGRAAGGPLGGLIGSLAGGLVVGAARTPIPLELHATVASDEGRPRLAAATGSVAGLPAGPLARLMLAVVLDRL